MEVEDRAVGVLNGVEWLLAPELVTPAGRVAANPHQSPNSPFINERPTVGDIARKYSWKVGKKEVRIIGHGDVPAHAIEENGWLLMKAIDYEGIVPQEALDRVRTLLNEGVEIKGLIIADDLRKYKPGKIRGVALRTMNRVRDVDWKKGRDAAIQRTSALASAGHSAARSIATGVREMANRIEWSKVRQILGGSLKVVAIGVAIIAGVAVAVAALAVAAALVAAAAAPVAVAAAPVAIVAYDPWMIVIDSENRRWVIAEW